MEGKEKKENEFDYFTLMHILYKELIKMFKTGTYASYLAEYSKNREYLNRIKIFNSILTMLDSFERIRYYVLNNEGKPVLKELNSNLMEKIINCFQSEGVNITGDNIDSFRNALAHAYYTVDANAQTISFYRESINPPKTINFTISSDTLEKIAIKIRNTITKRNSKIQIFDGIGLNDVINEICKESKELTVTPKIYASLLQSYNFYQAYLYEIGGLSYDYKMLLNSYLPFIKGDISVDKSDLTFNSLEFNSLTDASKFDTLYFLLTSEYRETAIKQLKEMLQIQDDTELLIYITAMYYIPDQESYDGFIKHFIGYHDEAELDEIKDKIEEYKKKLDKAKELSKISGIIDLMFKKMPRMNRIINRIDENDILPKSIDLLYGFDPTSSMSEFIYPPFDQVVSRKTKQDCLKELIDNNFEVLEIGSVIKSVVMYLCKDNRYSNLKLDENVVRFFKGLKNGKTPGKIPDDIKDELVTLVESDVNLKKEVLLEQAKNLNDIEQAYLCFFLIIKSGLDVGERTMENLKGDIQDRLSFEIKNEKDEKKERQYKKKKRKCKKYIKVNELISIMEGIPPYFDTYIDFFLLIEHIRNASIHGYTDVNYEDIDPNKELKIKQVDSIFEKNNSFEFNPNSVKFNFQDYNYRNGMTTFLLMNIPAKKAEKLFNIGADDIYKTICLWKRREKQTEKQQGEGEER